jgi:hypothetical protein
MRPPEVFVRELAPAEGQRLKRLSKRAKHASTRQRAAILLASATLMSPPEIARMLFESLRPRFGAGDPAGSRVTRSSASSPWPAPIPTRSGCPSPAGAFTSSPATCTGRGSGSRLRSWAGSSLATVSPCSAAAPGSRAPIPTTSRRRRASSPPPGGARKRRRHQLRREGAGKPLPPPRTRLGEARPAQRHRATYNRRQGIRYLVAALDVHSG